MAAQLNHRKLKENDVNANFPGWQCDAGEAVFSRIY